MRETKTIAMSEICEKRGLKCSDLVRKAGMQAGLIFWIETGRFVPYQSQVEKIARALDIEDPRDPLKDTRAIRRARCISISMRPRRPDSYGGIALHGLARYPIPGIFVTVFYYEGSKHSGQGVI